MTNQTHQWNDEFCTCGNDSGTCQVGGERVCSSQLTWVEGLGNVCFAHNDPASFALDIMVQLRANRRKAVRN